MIDKKVLENSWDGVPGILKGRWRKRTLLTPFGDSSEILSARGFNPNKNGFLSDKRYKLVRFSHSFNKYLLDAFWCETQFWALGTQNE